MRPAESEVTRERYSEVVGLTEQVILQTQQANTQLLGLSAELLQARREVQAAVRRMSVAVLLLCLTAVSGLFLGWRLLIVSDAVVLMQSKVTDTREALLRAEVQIRGLDALEEQLTQQARLLDQLVENAPRVKTGGGHLLLEVPVTDAAARAAGKLTSPTAPPVARKADLVIVQGRVEFRDR